MLCPSSFQQADTCPPSGADGDWRKLRSQLAEALGRSSHEQDALWPALVEHPWCQTELERAARRLVAAEKAPRDLAGDVAQEARLRLAQECSGFLDWEFRQMALDEFARRLRRIFTCHCRRALRRLWRPQESRIPVAEWHRTYDPAAALDMRLDLEEAISRLSDRERQVVALYAERWRLSQIARQTGWPHSTVRRIWRRALARLRRELGQEGGGPCPSNCK